MGAFQIGADETDDVEPTVEREVKHAERRAWAQACLMMGVDDADKKDSSMIDSNFHNCGSLR